MDIEKAPADEPDLLNQLEVRSMNKKSDEPTPSLEFLLDLKEENDYQVLMDNPKVPDQGNSVQEESVERIGDLTEHNKVGLKQDRIVLLNNRHEISSLLPSNETTKSWKQKNGAVEDTHCNVCSEVSARRLFLINIFAGVFLNGIINNLNK